MANFIASDKDLRAVEEGISYVWHPKLDFIFKDKEKIENVIVISFDSNNFYIWKHKKSDVSPIGQNTDECSLSTYELFKASHNLIIRDRYNLGWASVFLLEEKIPLEKILNFPEVNVINFQIISGSLLTHFTSSQKKKIRVRPLNPYTTHESYLATIVHEFGHAYFNNFHTWWYSNKAENLSYLNQALDLYQEANNNVSISKVDFPNYDRRLTLLSETFAFCTDYSAASIFWESHKRDIDKENISEIELLIKSEARKDLHQENSVLDPNPTAHNAAQTIGKILSTKYPDTWPEKILSLNYLPL